MDLKKAGNFFYVAYVVILVYFFYLFVIPSMDQVTAKQSTARNIVEKQFNNSSLLFPSDSLKVERSFRHSNISGPAAAGVFEGSFSKTNIVLADVLIHNSPDRFNMASAAQGLRSDAETASKQELAGVLPVQKIELSSLVNLDYDPGNVFAREDDRVQLSSDKITLGAVGQKKYYGGMVRLGGGDESFAKLYLAPFEGGEENEAHPAADSQHVAVADSSDPSATESDTSLDMAGLVSVTAPTSDVLQKYSDFKDLNIASFAGRITVNTPDIASKSEIRDFNKTYVVTKADTLFTIARNYGVSVSELMAANNIKSMEIQAGATIKVPSAPAGNINLLAGGSASGQGQNSPQPNLSLVLGNDEVKKLLWPCSTRKVTSLFGTRVHPIYHVKKFHNGLDIGAPYGSKIRAAESGIVVYSGNKSYYGRVVIIKHSRDTYTLYAHCSKLVARSGQAVKRGDLIAKIGSSGLSTGPHLHFGVQKNGKFVNPSRFF